MTDAYDITWAAGSTVAGRRKNNWTATTAPGAGDDTGDGYEVGSKWLDTVTGNIYECTDDTLTTANWEQLNGGAPTDADYLVGTAHADLSAEIVVGTTPGGELAGGGSTWASPVIASSHSGSAHHAQSHVLDGGDHTVSGLTIGHTLQALTATTFGFAASPAGTPASTVTDETTFGIATAVGTDTEYARQDHTHGSPTNPLTAHEAAGDPHTGYRLESADHSHATTGLQGGTIAHSVTTGQTVDDHHDEAHEITTAGPHTLAGGTAGDVLRVASATSAVFATLAHGDLSDAPTDAHHAEVHTVASTGPHAQSGLTAGHFLRASAAAAFDFAAITDSDVPGTHAGSAHHTQSHDHSAAGDGTTLDPAVLSIPESATPAQTASGSAVFDTANEILTIGDGVGRSEFGLLGTTNPVTQDYSDAAAPGSSYETARIDHVHGMPAAGSGAPSTADYLVGTADGGLSAEIVVGTTPNGELGGTWGAITVDATHSGSAHHAQSHVLATGTALGADHTMSGAVAGEVLRALSATTAAFDTLAHGDLSDAPTDAHHSETHVVDSTGPHSGSGLTAGHVLRASAATAFAFAAIQAGDLPATDWGETVDIDDITFGQVAAGGASTEHARADHAHGMVADPVTAHVAAGDPHTGYLQESVISGLATPAIVLGTAAGAGTGTTPIRHDSTIVAFDITVPVTQAFSDAAATGSAAVAARRDHVHGMPASPGGAPDTVDYLVGTADGGLSAEIVVGTTPNGELGGTWGAITVDATHSGSAHHAQAHVLATGTALGADHTISGAAAGEVLRALSATTAAFDALAHGDLSDAPTDAHHAEVHTMASTGPHAQSGLTAGHFLRASAAAAFDFAAIADADVPSTHAGSAHHAQSHVLDGGDHTVSGLTPGHVLQALTASTFGFAASPGGTPATTVTDETTFGISTAVGIDTEYARQDHTHGSPTNPLTAHESTYTHADLHARSHDHSNASDGTALDPASIAAFELQGDVTVNTDGAHDLGTWGGPRLGAIHVDTLYVTDITKDAISGQVSTITVGIVQSGTGQVLDLISESNLQLRAGAAAGVEMTLWSNDRLEMTAAIDLDMNGNVLYDVLDPTLGNHVGDRDYNDARYVQPGDSMTGELGGTFSAATVNATHSGSAHHTKYTDAEAVAAIETALGNPELVADTDFGLIDNGVKDTDAVRVFSNLGHLYLQMGDGDETYFRSKTGGVVATLTNAGTWTMTGAVTVPSMVVNGTITGTGVPGGQLGGTWSSPTVDASHSGSAHHAQSHDLSSHSDMEMSANLDMNLYDVFDVDEVRSATNANLDITASGSGSLILTGNSDSLVLDGSQFYWSGGGGNLGHGSHKWNHVYYSGTLYGGGADFQAAVDMNNKSLHSPLDPTGGTGVGDRDYNDARYGIMARVTRSQTSDWTISNVTTEYTGTHKNFASTIDTTTNYTTYFDVTTNAGEIRIKVAGKYLLVGNVEWLSSGGSSGRLQLTPHLNGSATSKAGQTNPMTSHAYRQNFAFVDTYAANADVGLAVLQNSGGNMTVTNFQLTVIYLGN